MLTLHAGTNVPLSSARLPTSSPSPSFYTPQTWKKFQRIVPDFLFKKWSFFVSLLKIVKGSKYPIKEVGNQTKMLLFWHLLNSRCLIHQALLQMKFESKQFTFYEGIWKFCFVWVCVQYCMCILCDRDLQAHIQLHTKTHMRYTKENDTQKGSQANQ